MSQGKTNSEIKFYQIFPSKHLNSWREKCSKIHHKWKCNSQNKMSNQKNFRTEKKSMKKNSEKMFMFIIFTQPLRSGRIWHKVNFLKRSLTGLNSDFSFSKTSCLTKAEEPSLSYYLPIAGGRIIGFIPFPKGISAMWNVISPGFELVSPCPIPATITITPRAPPKMLTFMTIVFLENVSSSFSSFYKVHGLHVSNLSLSLFFLFFLFSMLSFLVCFFIFFSFFTVCLQLFFLFTSMIFINTYIFFSEQLLIICAIFLQIT